LLLLFKFWVVLDIGFWLFPRLPKFIWGFVAPYLIFWPDIKPLNKFPKLKGWFWVWLCGGLEFEMFPEFWFGLTEELVLALFVVAVVLLVCRLTPWPPIRPESNPLMFPKLKPGGTWKVLDYILIYPSPSGISAKSLLS
jgi:hypothetical protein